MVIRNARVNKLKDCDNNMIEKDKKKEKEPQFQSGESVDKMRKGLYGLDPETSLLSVNFAPGENAYLNEHYQEEP
jgi:hypothetical protein